MLKKIQLHNFQCYVDQEIELSPGLNLFTGPSNSGKSAIVRVLDWILFNKPRRGNSDLLRKGASECSGSLEFEDCKVERFRSEWENGYRLWKGEKCAEFLSIGSEVPQEISEALRIHPFEAGDEECILNLASQLEPHFLVTLSPVHLYKYIADLTGLGYIGRALHLANREVLQVQREVLGLEAERFENWKVVRDTWGTEVLLAKSGVVGNKLEELDALEQVLGDLVAWETEWNSLEDLSWVEFWALGLEGVSRKFASWENAKALGSLLEFWVSLPEFEVPSLARLEQVQFSVGCLEDYYQVEQDLSSLEKELGKIEQERKELQRQYPFCPVCERPWAEKG